MATYAVIENQKVVNICVATEEDIKPHNWVLLDNPSAGIDWDYVYGVFVDNRVFEAPLTTSQVSTPTKEELLAQLALLQQQIAALSE